MEKDIHRLLRAKRDAEALTLLQTGQASCDDEVIVLALDNGCQKTIKYLRQQNLITLAGKKRREAERQKAFAAKLAALENMTNLMEKDLKNRERIKK